jgi:predicted enzyme related to lactoylglutathione lyase
MINYIVEDLASLMAELRAKGASMNDRIDNTEYGCFAWISYPEGNRLKLWEPPKAVPNHVESK